MNSVDARTVPADPESARRLREQGFDYRVVDIADYGSAVAFAQAAERGFLGGAPSDAEIERMRETWEERRNVGVYEADAVASALPVGTVNSWVASMSLPGGDARSAIPMWAISMVTVAATHRRRGIARGLLEGELRAAASAGVPVAGLTVTEATIYGRYGFGPAVPVSRIAVDARASGWRAPQAPGRLEYVGLDELARELGELHERARFARAGQIAGWRGRWLGQAGLGAGSKKDASARGVHYRDVDGVVRGAIAYTLKELPGSFRNSMTIRQLVAETDDALSALWGFAVNHDLVDRIEADLRPVDDPVVRLVANPHAVDVAVRDHGWLRILDAPAALRARRYAASLDTVIRVEDGYGFADGTWRLSIDAAGAAEVEATDAAPDVVLDVATLSSAYAGGVPLTQLAAAGRVQGDAAAVTALGRALHADPAPTLSIWY
ncbi:GNAT family N-acetyltransferase [Microbacterium arabinogalactanolyticum]|uniref:GNAT family N-acetyltransferase n=1 Tax=Microbacterium arabinogalactanolyticum TaxID=69365 RepID=UPI004043952E